MTTIKLSPFKKILMSLLMAMLNATYHVDASAYSILVTGNTTSCATNCKNNGHFWGHPLNCLNVVSIELHSGLVSYYTNSNGKCLCLNSMEKQALDNCGARAYCTGYGGVSNTNSGYRDHVLNTYNSFNCASGYGNCYCKTGYYAKNQSCVICPTGYSCYGGRLASVGLSTTQGSTACGAGYYQSQTGKSVCNACSVGTYQANPARSYCNPCPTGSYIDRVGATTCNTCPSLAGVAGATDGTGATAITKCFVPSDMEFTESATGHKYAFSSDCYYVS